MPAFELFADSFSAYKVAVFTDAALLKNFKANWTNYSGISTTSITTGGRNGHGLRMPFGNTVAKTLNHSTTFTVGFAFKLENAQSGNDAIFTLNNNNVVIASLLMNFDGTMAIVGRTSIPLGVSNRSLHVGIFYWIDFTVTISGGTPLVVTAELRINTHVEISGSVNLTLNASDLISNDATMNNYTVTGPTGTAVYSQFFIKNTTGYYGDIDIIALVPNGDVVSDWTPSTGSIHYVLVNSLPVDLTKFIETAVINNKDIWDWQDCPGFSGTIKAIDARILARKDDEGTKSFKIVVGDTGTEAASPEFFVSDSDEEYYHYGLENDPGTSLPWTQVGFNAKRFGVKLIS